MIASLLVLACGEPTADEAAARAKSDPPSEERGSPLPGERAVTPGPIAEAPPEAEAPPPTAADAPPEDPQTEAGEAPSAAKDPADPLAPIMPSGPEPGSPEADAELAALLEESTITQEEFDAAFRGKGPKIAGDRMIFGPSDRTRKRPVVKLGSPTITGSSLAAAEITALAKADLRELEGCLAAALTDDPGAGGELTLGLRFDPTGAVESAQIEGELDASLKACLLAVVDDWSLPGAATAGVTIPLTLSGE